MVSGSILANYFSPEYLPGGNGGGSLDFLTRVSFGGERGNFLTRVSFQGKKGEIFISLFPFHGTGMRTGVFSLLLGH